MGFGVLTARCVHCALVWSLWQDNDPIHNAGAVFDWLERNGVSRDANFPPYSPDLNLIEHVWAWLAERMRGRTVLTAEALLKAIADEWSQIDPVMLNRLYLSWHRRLNAVVKANGGHTKY
jgi:transposase